MAVTKIMKHERPDPKLLRSYVMNSPLFFDDPTGYSTNVVGIYEGPMVSFDVPWSQSTLHTDVHAANQMFLPNPVSGVATQLQGAMVRSGAFVPQPALQKPSFNEHVPSIDNQRGNDSLIGLTSSALSAVQVQATVISKVGDTVYQANAHVSHEMLPEHIKNIPNASGSFARIATKASYAAIVVSTYKAVGDYKEKRYHQLQLNGLDVVTGLVFTAGAASSAPVSITASGAYMVARPFGEWVAPSIADKMCELTGKCN